MNQQGYRATGRQDEKEQRDREDFHPPISSQGLMISVSLAGGICWQSSARKPLPGCQDARLQAGRMLCAATVSAPAGVRAPAPCTAATDFAVSCQQLETRSSAATDSVLFNRIWADNGGCDAAPFRSVPICCASNRGTNALFWPNL